ncbi:MAG: PRC-barrel domain-containing protein [Bacillus sp. (in: Bacteria)]|nr:PRC-barrel domain-containing protein [Bacillus sp. (in: firmicutes)]
MRTFQKVKGTAIIQPNTTEIIGTISDLVLSKDITEVKGYWVQTKKWWSKKHFLSIEDVIHQDIDGMYIDSGTNLQPITKEDKRLIEGNGHIIGHSVKDKDGIMIGIIEDVYFLPESGKIVGYELTEGLFSDFSKGIKLLKPKIPLIQREKSFMVPNES